MSDQRRPTTALLGRVDEALTTVPAVARRSATGRLALVHAEAIDDDDEGDGWFRFGPRLRTALETLGLGLLARSLLLPPPMSGGRPSVEQPDERAGAGAPLRHLGGGAQAA